MFEKNIKEPCSDPFYYIYIVFLSLHVQHSVAILNISDQVHPNVFSSPFCHCIRSRLQYTTSSTNMKAESPRRESMENIQYAHHSPYPFPISLTDSIGFLPLGTISVIKTWLNARIKFNASRPVRQLAKQERNTVSFQTTHRHRRMPRQESHAPPFAA